MTTPHTDLIEGFANLSRDLQATELDAALLVNQALHPAVDLPRVRQAVKELVAPEGVPVWQHLAQLGFSGDDVHYHDLLNSRMDAVIERRKGIPITLAVLLISVARAGGEAAEGLNAPGHFLSRVGAQVVDPFSMRALDVSGDVATAGPTDIALRMLNNVKQNLNAGNESARALDMVDYQIALIDESQRPTLAMLLLEKGEYWRTLGAGDLAVENFERALSYADDGSDIATVCRARIEQLSGAAGATFH